MRTPRNARFERSANQSDHDHPAPSAPSLESVPMARRVLDARTHGRATSDIGHAPPSVSVRSDFSRHLGQTKG